MDHAWTVRAPIAKVANEDELALIGVRAIGPVAESGEERPQRLELPVDISDDVEWPRVQGAGNEG
jgi:hypothetical protein